MSAKNIWEVIAGASSDELRVTDAVELPSKVTDDLDAFVKHLVVNTMSAQLEIGRYTQCFPLSMTEEKTGNVKSAVPSFAMLVLAQLYLERLCYSEGTGGARLLHHTVAVGRARPQKPTGLTAAAEGSWSLHSTK